MPYKIERNEKKEHCVYKEDEDGNAMGDSLGCHDTKKEAVAQIGAIESEEKKSTNVPVEDGGDHENTIINEVDESAQSSHKGDPSPSIKMSLDKMVQDVLDAFRKEYDYAAYVPEVFEDYAIVCLHKKYYRAPYTRNERDIEISSLNEWTQVEMEQNWTDVMNKMYAIKELGDGRVGGWAVLYGSELEKDLHGEYFTSETEEYDALFKAMGALPWLVQHASDNTLKTTVVAVVDTLVEKDAGWWYEAKIREHDIYNDYVQPLIEKKILSTSSGTLPAAKRVTKSGEITRWPISEVTGTWTPADWRQVEQPVSEIKAHYKSIGVSSDLIAKFFDKEKQEAEEEDQGTEKARLELMQRQLELERERLTI